MIVKLKDRREIAKDTLELVFDTLGQDIGFKAGAYFKLTLLNPLYKDQRGIARFLGFSSSPSIKEYFTTTTRTGPSAYKRTLMEMPIGTEVEIGELGGRVNQLPDDTSQHIVIVAGGIGICPIIGILRYCKEQNWPYNMTLVYSNTDVARAVYLSELEGFAKDTDKFKLITTITGDAGWSGEKRRINAEFIKEYFPDPEKNVYAVTGTPRFVPGVFREIQAAGVPIINIKMELFTGY